MAFGRTENVFRQGHVAFVDRFFRRFIAKKGYKDGYYGFVAAVLSGFHEFAAYSKYREIKEKGYYLPKADPK